MLLPQLVRALPTGLEHTLVRWVPGGQVVGVMTESINQKIPYMFAPWGELAIFAGYATVLVAAGSIVFIRRDA
jgi:hypothetical protein